MNLDSEDRPPAATSISFKAVEAIHIQISSLADGAVFLAVSAITLDSQEPELLTQEIASERVASMEDALTLINARLRAMTTPSAPIGS